MEAYTIFLWIFQFIEEYACYPEADVSKLVRTIIDFLENVIPTPAIEKKKNNTQLSLFFFLFFLRNTQLSSNGITSHY